MGNRSRRSRRCVVTNSREWRERLRSPASEDAIEDALKLARIEEAMRRLLARAETGHRG